MTRHQDWPARLLETIEQAEMQRFDYGTWDCGQFVGAVSEAMTGHNPVAGWRGRYTTEAGMKRILNRDYNGSIVDFWTSVLGEPIAPVMASRGDAVVIEHDGVQASGVIDTSGERVAVLGLDGLEYLPLTTVIAAWRI